MNAYEAVFIFRPEDDLFLRGKETVKTELAQLKTELVSEEDMGQRVLAYPIQKQIRGHYYLFNFNADPQSLSHADRTFKLKSEILKFLFVRKGK